jgi:nucleotide-binding universal stress UspA family protein
MPVWFKSEAHKRRSQQQAVLSHCRRRCKRFSCQSGRGLATQALDFEQPRQFMATFPWRNARHGEEPGADIAHYLSRHGAHVSLKRTTSHGEPIAKVILDHAKEHAADLIVIGAYSHARTAQMVFGGVTRSLLRDAAVPLLIAH